MQEKQLYEYAVIRVVPRVDREEFINVGIIIFCKQNKYVGAQINVDKQKLMCIDPESDVAQICENLDAFIKISSGSEAGGVIARLDAAERFRWLTAVRSSSIQTSRPHPGLSGDLNQTLQRLMKELVL